MFELFDFNEIKSLSKTDLEFLLFCCISSSLKIYGYADECPRDTSIHELVQGSLSTSVRVTLNNLLHFCAFSEEINAFLQFFKVMGLNLPKPSKKADVFEPLRNKDVFPSSVPAIERNLQQKIEYSSKSWIGAVIDPVSKQSTVSEGIGKFTLHWVLGIRSESCKHNIGIVPGNDIIVYFVSSVAVILYCNLLKQKHYTEHSQDINSVALTKQLACTAEAGNSPKIRIWRIKTLETVQVLSGIHQTPITLLGFTNNEQHLVSCSTYTVVIYDWKTKNILVTTNHTQQIVDLYLLPRITSNSCFILGCTQEFTIYTIGKDRLNIESVSIDLSMTKSKITSIAGQGIYDLKTENRFTLLTGHLDGTVLLWESADFQRILIIYESIVTSIQAIVKWYAIATGLGLIYFWDSGLESCHKIIELSMFTFKLLSFEVNSMIFCNKKLYVNTVGGDLIEIKINFDCLKVAPKRVSGIIPIHEGQTRVCLLSTDLPFLVLGGRTGTVIIIDLRSYEIIDTWAVGYEINAICAKKINENILLGLGCEEGRIFIRENWDTVFKPEAGSNTITDLQFINQGKILIVSSEDANLYVFKKGESYEKIYIISIENGVPISLNYSKDKQNLLIVTDKRKIMMMTGETYDLNFTFESVAGIRWSKLRTYFYASLKDHVFKLPVAWNSKGDCIAMGGLEGVHVWKDAQKVHNENGQMLKGHTGSIIDLCLKSSILFTLGTDRMVMYWNYEKATIDLINKEDTKDILEGCLKKEFECSLGTQKDTLIEYSEQFVQSAFLMSVSESCDYFFSYEESNKPLLLSLDLKYIYGGRVNMRRSLYYIHLHNSDSPPLCQRNLIYPGSRYPILFNPVSLSQSFYTNHSHKITAIDVHPSLELIASCDQNFIHIWKTRTKVQVSKLTSTLKSIYMVKFGNNKQGGDILAAVGLSSTLYGLEIFDWNYETVLAKVAIYNNIQDILFHPEDLFKVYLCGENYFSIWKRNGRMMRCKLEVKHAKVLTVMKFLVFRQRKEIDLLIGTSKGELVIGVEGRLLVHVSNAHDGSVLCITTAEYQGSGLVFTGGQDGYIKIWSHAIILMNKFHINAIRDPIISAFKSHEICNLEVYTCNAKKSLDATLPKGARIEPLVLAICTSSGALLEVSLAEISSDQMTLQYKVCFETHCTDARNIKKQLIALHWDLPILASIGDDKSLKIWDYEKHTCIGSKELDSKTAPCAVEFSSNGLLGIGMENGVVIIIGCKNNGWGFKSELVLDVLLSVRESSAAILCINFTADSEYMAISFDNYKGMSSLAEVSSIKTAGLDMNTGFVVLFQSDDLSYYKKISKIVLPFGNLKDIGNYPPRSECAVTSIEFSEDNLYIAMFHQKVLYKDHVPGK